jgi:hypothetical protein
LVRRGTVKTRTAKTGTIRRCTSAQQYRFSFLPPFKGGGQGEVILLPLTALSIERVLMIPAEAPDNLLKIDREVHGLLVNLS